MKAAYSVRFRLRPPVAGGEEIKDSMVALVHGAERPIVTFNDIVAAVDKEVGVRYGAPEYEHHALEVLGVAGLGNVDVEVGPCPVAEERDRLKALLNAPEIVDFGKAIVLEAAHQRERWGSEHDEGKTCADWYWLIGYLAGKALFSFVAGNREKTLHHIITTAAACCNWHAQILGKSDMRPGHLGAIEKGEAISA